MNRISLCLILFVTGCHTAKFPSEMYVFDEHVVLNSPSRLDANRIRIVTTSPYPIYATIGDGLEQPVAVAMHLNDAALFGNSYVVLLLNEKKEVLRTGILRCQMYQSPYCLLQVRTQNDYLPKHLRGQWMLAVGLVQRSEFDRNKTLQPYAGVVPRDIDPSAMPLAVEPIIWKSDDDAVEAGVGLLGYATFDVRAAEKVFQNILPEQTVEIVGAGIPGELTANAKAPRSR